MNPRFERAARAMRLRDARLADAVELARVHIACWLTTYRGIIPDSCLDALDPVVRADRWRQRLAELQPPQCVLVVEDDQEAIVGWAYGGPERDGIAGYDGELYAIYLLAEHRRQGLGRLLLTTMAHRLAGYGFRSLLVWVLRDNPSRRFYEALGGVPVGEKSIAFDDSPLPEVSYGWPDLRQLLPEDVVERRTSGEPHASLRAPEGYQP